MPKIAVTGKQYDGWQPLPAATYDFKIDNVEDTTSKNGNQQLKLTMTVMDGPSSGKKCTNWYVLTEKSIWKLAALCEATGVGEVTELMDQIDPETGKPALHVELESEDLIGCALKCDVTIEEYNGKEQNRFNNERPIDGAQAAASNGNGAANTSTTTPAPTSAPMAGAGQQLAGAAAGAAGSGAAAGQAVRRRRTV